MASVTGSHFWHWRSTSPRRVFPFRSSSPSGRRRTLRFKLHAAQSQRSVARKRSIHRTNSALFPVRNRKPGGRMWIQSDESSEGVPRLVVAWTTARQTSPLSARDSGEVCVCVWAFDPTCPRSRWWFFALKSKRLQHDQRYITPKKALWSSLCFTAPLKHKFTHNT